MSLDTIRLSQTARDQLIKLKRVTGIKNWNVLCRWSLALSLADLSPPLVREIVTDSNVEMSWRTFSGSHGDIYLALLKQRCMRDEDSLSDEGVARTLTIHLHRGIGYLAGGRNLVKIEDLMRLALLSSTS
ncbi:DNA sulfur modification protein DndE [Streptosporangium saharense]|uniref:DNA sulfur modification protein DndE n=1 Tax=Streptosporangium saharense TaxID=1706840 RepID=A0A7W7QPT0_9ACTN|nr:DNA sulfur modification protein DndE [Streptosporangium saharense]MBB4917448.1 DNA sulfur modification protein DndE [Streptosporangium saharense]